MNRDDVGFEEGERPGLPVEPFLAAGLWLLAFVSLMLKILEPSGTDLGEFRGHFIQVLFTLGFTGYAVRLGPAGWKRFRVEGRHVLFLVAGLAFLTSLSCLFGVGSTGLILYTHQ